MFCWKGTTRVKERFLVMYWKISWMFSSQVQIQCNEFNPFVPAATGTVYSAGGTMHTGINSLAVSDFSCSNSYRNRRDESLPAEYINTITVLHAQWFFTNLIFFF